MDQDPMADKTRNREPSQALRPDMSRVPYPRKGLYLALTVPVLLIMAAVGVYLGTFNMLLPAAFVLLYVLTNAFQAYCCAHQRCPYVGGFCPAVIGIMPASFLAKWLYRERRMVRSRARFERHAVIAAASWLGMVVFPLFWLAKLGTGFAISYGVVHAVYALVFWLTICPACAIRDICPGGKLHRSLGTGRNRGQPDGC